MGKLSKRVSRGLGSAIKEAKDKINGVETNINDPEDIENITEQSDAEALLNSGVNAQKKRKKKTKAETKVDDSNSLFEALEYPQEDTEPRSFEEFCERELQQAKEKGYPEPDFDFRNFYEKGNTVYYVRVLESYGTKEIINMKLRTIYPRMMVGATESGCQCVGYKERDQVFFKHHEAEAYSDSLQLTPKYVLSGSKSKKNDDEGTDERVEAENVEIEASATSEEVLNEQADKS